MTDIRFHYATHHHQILVQEMELSYQCCHRLAISHIDHPFSSPIPTTSNLQTHVRSLWMRYQTPTMGPPRPRPMSNVQSHRRPQPHTPLPTPSFTTHLAPCALQTRNRSQIHTHRPQSHTPPTHCASIMALSHCSPNITTSASSRPTANHWMVRLSTRTNFHQLAKTPSNLLPLHKQ